jgi:hypothetical protein
MAPRAMRKFFKIVMVTIGYAIALVILAVFALEIIGRMVPKLNVPNAGAVERVVWKQKGGDPGSDRGVIITDPGRISKLLNLIEAKNSMWKKPMIAPIPTGQHHLVFRSKEDRLLLVMWIGETVIAGRNGAQDSTGNRSRSVSKQRSEEIVAVLERAVKT